MTSKLGLLLLAAGGSSRLGQPKQLLPIDGHSLVQRMARVLVSLQQAHTAVVVGGASKEVRAELASLPVQVLHNPDWRDGMGTSIALGAEQLPAELDGLLILLCDQWRVDTTDLKRLIFEWSSDISCMVVSSWNDAKGRTYGPPAIFPRKYFHELKMLKGDHGARSVISLYQHNARFIELENAAFDVDVPADLSPFAVPAE